MFHQFFDIGFGVGESHWTLKKLLFSIKKVQILLTNT